MEKILINISQTTYKLDIDIDPIHMNNKWKKYFIYIYI